MHSLPLVIWWFQQRDGDNVALTLGGESCYWLEDGTTLEDKVYEGLLQSRNALGIPNESVPRHPLYRVRCVAAAYASEAHGRFNPGDDVVLLSRFVVGGIHFTFHLMNWILFVYSNIFKCVL